MWGIYGIIILLCPNFAGDTPAEWIKLCRKIILDESSLDHIVEHRSHVRDVVTFHMGSGGKVVFEVAMTEEVAKEMASAAVSEGKAEEQ